MYKVYQKRKGQLYAENTALSAKKTRKNGFFGVLRYAPEQFGMLLCHTKDNQTHIITTQLDAQGVETKKRQLYWEEICVAAWKTAKEGEFFAVLMSALERFDFLLYDSDDLQTHKSTIQSDLQIVAAIKNACLE